MIIIVGIGTRQLAYGQLFVEIANKFQKHNLQKNVKNFVKDCYIQFICIYKQIYDLKLLKK